ncbi:NADH dehydrogenase [ubiquinone] 1 beta subcomplex subunit 3 [Anoplolepis gracilipes]|uniref:NADH dehydrogenase [ubiquinone] 1 beta subcomplex subunit 3 n=1 Tax=Anoplolepis gracilipes TaxID=354296 RepID=UPI003BA19F30
MGGHKGQPYKIPSPDIYKVEDVPQLKCVQEELAKKGLKDPWLRNHVWRYQSTQPPLIRGLVCLTRGWKLGIPAFLVTIAVEQYFGIDYHGHHDEGHH